MHMKQKIFVQTLLVIVLALFGVSFAQAVSEASLYFVPSVGTYQKADEFDVELKINSQEPVTSIKAYVTYDPRVFSVRSFQVNGTTFPFWWEKESTPGLLKLQASVPAPGFQGEQTVATLHLKTERKSGDAAIGLDPSSLVLNSNDEDTLHITSSSVARFLVGDASSSSQGQLFLLVVGGFAVLALCGILLLKRSPKKKVRGRARR